MYIQLISRCIVCIMLVTVAAAAAPETLAQEGQSFLPGTRVLVHEADDGGLTLYSAPDIEAVPITTLPPGTLLTVTAGPKDVEGNVWWRVRSDSGEGWVAPGVEGGGTLDQFQMDRIGMAVVDLTRTIENNPEEATGYIERGMIYHNLANDGQAVSDFTNAIELQPDTASLYNYRGLAHLSLGAYGAAIADFDRALELKPDEAVFYNNRGRAYAASLKTFSNYDQAIADFSRAIDANSAYGTAYDNRGKAYYEMYRYIRYVALYEDAIADFARAIEIDPYHASAYHHRGEVYQNTGMFDAAFNDFNSAIKVDPGYLPAYQSLGEFYIDRAYYDDAFGVFNRVLEIDPDNAAAYSYRGLTLALYGNFDSAFADFEQALTLDPQNADFHINRAQGYKAAGDFEAALEELEIAANLDPHAPRVYYAFDEIYTRTGDSEAIITSYARAVEHNEDFVDLPSYYVRRALVYFNTGDLLAAIADCSNALDLNPRYGYAYFLRGHFQQEIEAYDQAIDDYKQATIFNPYLIDAPLALGALLTELGRVEEAYAVYEHYRSLELPNVDVGPIVERMQALQAQYGNP